MVARNGHRTYAKKPGLLPLKPGVWCTRPHALPLLTHPSISLPVHESRVLQCGF